MIKLIITQDDFHTEKDIQMAFHAQNYALALWNIKQEIKAIINRDRDEPLGIQEIEDLLSFVRREIEGLPEAD